MKNPKRSRHRSGPPPWATPAPVVVSESYEREVAESTRRLEQRYEQARRRATRAEQRLRDARADTRRKTRAGVIAQLEVELELRREELAEYERLMKSTAASAEHRGVRSYRPVPTPGGGRV